MKNKRVSLPAVCGALALLLTVGTSLGWAQGQSKAFVVRATKHAVAPPLSQMPLIPPQAAQLNPFEAARTRSEESALVHGLNSSRSFQSVVLEGTADATAAAQLSTNAGVNILGLGAGFSGFSASNNIPSANGAAGTTQFVQFANDAFAVFNKSNGSLAFGPASINTLWQALGAPCSSNPNMDSIVQFDQLANVWVILMPLYTTPPYFCIAVSTTSDATGSWNLYVFEAPVNTQLCHCRMMPDYPKLALWPDAYYISYHQAWNLNYEGPVACAVNRNAMLSGSAATMQCFANTGTGNNAWLPSDLDGATPPPTGSPNYFLGFDPNDQSLDLWQFHVDWTNPANSTLTGPTNIPVAPFLEPCGDTVTVFTPQDNCVPQAGTSNMLGAFGDEVMYRLAYRNFGSSQSLVVNHTVQVASGSNQTGLRWYELQNTGSGFGLFQQGTYAPDSNYRWMGSIAMDKVGDIALGYNVSSSSMSPSIRYTGRLSTDTLGTMEGEVDVLSSAGISPGSQTNTPRWGDYSSLAVDPTDDCTFWYTTEYMPANGGNWGTRIASFVFPSCIPNFTLSVAEVGHGTVTSSDGAINCTNGTGSCSAVYPSGTAVTLNAAGATGWALSGWSGACTGGNPCNLVMNSNLSATATFATTTQSWTLSVSESGQGTVTSTDGTINCANGSGTCSALYLSGSSVTLNASAPSGWAFSGWSGPCSGSGSCNLQVTGNTTATATFTTSWAIVNKTSRQGNPLTSLTIPATGSGNLIAIALMFNGTTSVASVTDNAGNAYVSAGARSTVNQYTAEIWYAVNAKPGATVVTPTYNGSPTHMEITEWEVSGLHNGPPDKTAVISQVKVLTNNAAGAPATTTQLGDFVVSILLANTSKFTTISSGNEFTDDFNINGNGWAHLTNDLAAPGTHQASWFTSSPAGSYCSSTVAFLPGP